MVAGIAFEVVEVEGEKEEVVAGMEEVDGENESAIGTLGKDSASRPLDFLEAAGEKDEVEVAGTLEEVTPVVAMGDSVVVAAADDFLAIGEELRARPMISCALAE